LLFVEWEVGFANLPGYGDFDEDTGDKPFQGLLAWEEVDNTSVLRVRFWIWLLRFSQQLEVRRRCLWASGKAKTAKPSGSFSSAQAASLGCIPSRFDEDLETLLGVGKVIGIENNYDNLGDFALRMLLGGDGFLGVLLGMELATLSRSAV